MSTVKRRGLAVAVAAAAALATLPPVVTPPAQAATAPVQGAEESLGYPIASRVLSPESSLGTDAEGRSLAFWVTNGNLEVPGMFQVTDVFAQEVVFQQRVPAGINSWANTFSEEDGTVYFAMTEGQLYSWTPGDEQITDHGTPFPGEGIWRLAAAPDGTVYGGTYPGGLLFSFDPETGESENLGQVNPGETYVRSIAVDDEYVYVGSQPNAMLSRYDRETGEIVEIPLPAKLGAQSEVYDQTLAGGYLFVRVQPSNTMVVYDTSNMSVVNTVEKITARVISQADPTGRFVYFRLNNGVDPVGIYKYDLQTHEYASTGFNPNAFPGAFDFVELPDQENFPGYSLVMTYYNGRIYVWNETTRRSIYIGESALEGTPNPVQHIGSGPDGKIYVSGFLSPPGMAQFDPTTDEFTLLSGAGQVEGFGTFGDALVLGRYPNADLLRFDTTAPWANGTNPGPAVSIGSEQDRPHELMQVGDAVAVASVPKSGRLGGAITMWDPMTNEMTVHQSPVADQSVVSLAERDGVVYGGTSVNGGYGIDPVATEAELFGFDLETGEVTFSTVPVPGAESINALAFDDDGLLWGIAEGVVFAFDPATGEVARSEQVFARSGGMYGTGRGLVFRDDGFLYGVSGGQLRRIDPQTLESVQLARTSVNNLTEGADGNLYYSRIATLYRWNFDLAAEPVEVTPGAVTFIDEDGTDADFFTVPVTAGVEYLVGDKVVAAGSHPGSGTVMVRARATEGYVLAEGATSEWSHTFGTTGGEPGPPSRGAEFHLSNDWRGTTDHFFMYGRMTDEVFVGDWDGDGTDSIAVRRGNRFHVSNAPRGGEADRVFPYGRAGDVVLVGDWDGDGVDTLAVRRGAEYHVKNSLGGGEPDVVIYYGRSGDAVLVGDWDGDGRDTLAVRRGADYHLKNSMSAGEADRVVRYGRAQDVTLAGDWNGDGTDTFAVRRGAEYHVKNSLRGGQADVVTWFGRPGDEVVVGDWDRDGADTLGIRRPIGG